MPTRFIERPGWQYELLGETEAHIAVDQARDAYADAVVAATPYRTGWYRGDFSGGLGEATAQGEHGTAASRLTTTSSLWHLIEFGSIHNPAYAPMQRGADEVGLRWENRG